MNELNQEWRELGDKQAEAAKALREARRQLELAQNEDRSLETLLDLEEEVRLARITHRQIGDSRSNIGGMIDDRSDAWDIL